MASPSVITSWVGCASHSDFQNQKEKVLTDLYNKIPEDVLWLDISDVQRWIRELRQEGER